VYVLNGFSNTLSVISPASWSVTNTVDFTALGVTTGTGTAAANVWAMGVNARGSEIYVTHPYGTARMSVIERSGATPAVTPQAVAPGQDTETVPTEPVNSPWSGPAVASPAAAPAGAVDVGQPTLRWAFNEYAKAWTRDPLGSTTLTDDQFTLRKGTGWVEPKTGAASIAWSDGFRFRHYAELAPDVISTYGNPVLTINAAGTGTLTFDVAWSVAADTKSNGFKRVPVATFTDAAVSVNDGELTISGTPDYTGRTYTDVNGTAHANSFPAEFIDWFDPGMRAWWYTTGASMDAKKTPLPLTASGSVELPDEPTTPVPSDEPTTPVPSTEPTGTPTTPGTTPSTSPETPAATLSTGGTTTFTVGDRIPVSATGLAANTTYQIVLHSDPVVLGSVTTDTAGAFSTSVVIPTGTPAGSHTIQVETADGEAVLALAITVTDDGAVVVDPVSTVGATVNTGGTTTGPAAGPWIALSAGGAITLIAVAVIAYRRRSQH
jgi:hypothetical protein